jgi:hypothetical protein
VDTRVVGQQIRVRLPPLSPGVEWKSIENTDAPELRELVTVGVSPAFRVVPPLHPGDTVSLKLDDRNWSTDVRRVTLGEELELDDSTRQVIISLSKQHLNDHDAAFPWLQQWFNLLALPVDPAGITPDGVWTPTLAEHRFVQDLLKYRSQATPDEGPCMFMIVLSVAWHAGLRRLTTVLCDALADWLDTVPVAGMPQALDLYPTVGVARLPQDQTVIHIPGARASLAERGPVVLDPESERIEDQMDPHAYEELDEARLTGSNTVFNDVVPPGGRAHRGRHKRSRSSSSYVVRRNRFMDSEATTQWRPPPPSTAWMVPPKTAGGLGLVDE